MTKQYILNNIKSNDFSYKLDSMMESKSISTIYSFDNTTNILSLEGNIDGIANDYVILRECIHAIDESIEIAPYTVNDVYRKVLTLQNLDCANCANKVEALAKKNFKHESIVVDFATSRFVMETKDVDTYNNCEEKLQELCKMIDRNILVVNKSEKKAVAQKERRINMILFTIGATLFIAEVILHYIVMPRVYDAKDLIYAPDGIIPNECWWLILMCFVSYILLGGDVLLSALSNIKNGRVFDEKFLMTVATIIAFIIGSYLEAVSVMIFYKLGEILQQQVVNNSRKSIARLMDIKPSMARIIFNDKEMEVDPSEIVIGDTIIVKPGERIPIDGLVIDGDASIDTSALTGESKYSEVTKGSKIISGSINIDGYLKIKVLKDYQDSMVNKILEYVQNANSKKGETEKFITKFAKYYTPSICLLALLIVIINFLVGIFTHEDIFSHRFIHDCIYPGMIFLVVSCPCALVISVPLSYFGAIGGASKKGILIKGSIYLEQLDNVGRVIFDKTGTLTKAKFKIKDIVSLDEEYTSEDIFRLTAYCEITSNHPLANAIVSAYGKDNINFYEVESIENNKRGSIVRINDKIYTVGNFAKLKDQNIKFEEIEVQGQIIYIACDKKVLGYITLEDEVREEAKETIDELKSMNIDVSVFTGDNKQTAEYVCSELGIDSYYSSLNPIDKVKKLRKLKKTLNNQNQIFVGDGINDTPVLSNADVGVAMGSFGTDAAIEVADVVLMTDEIKKIPLLIRIAKKTKRIVYQNIIFALAVKLIVLIMAIILKGIPLMWEAVFADVGVSLIATINSMRASNIYVENEDKKDEVLSSR